MKPCELDFLLQYHIVVTPVPVYHAKGKRVTKVKWRPEIWQEGIGDIWHGEPVSTDDEAWRIAATEHGVIAHGAWKNEYDEWFDTLPEAQRRAMEAEDAADERADALLDIERGK